VFGELIQFNDADSPIYCVTAGDEQGDVTESAD